MNGYFPNELQQISNILGVRTPPPPLHTHTHILKTFSNLQVLQCGSDFDCTDLWLKKPGGQNIKCNTRDPNSCTLQRCCTRN